MPSPIPANGHKNKYKTCDFRGTGAYKKKYHLPLSLLAMPILENKYRVYESSRKILCE